MWPKNAGNYSTADNETNMNVRNGTRLMCEFERNRRHLVDVRSVVTVNFQ